jgi:hypothetical protein
MTVIEGLGFYAVAAEPGFIQPGWCNAFAALSSVCETYRTAKSALHEDALQRMQQRTTAEFDPEYLCEPHVLVRR